MAIGRQCDKHAEINGVCFKVVVFAANIANIKYAYADFPVCGE